MTQQTTTVVKGSVWLIGAQVASFGMQLVYAAISSRLVGPISFAAYAIAFSAVALVGILANAGLGQALTRDADLPVATQRAVSTFAVATGLAAGAAVLALSDVWTSLWGGTNEANSAVQWLALSSFVAPFLGVLFGHSRRNSQFIYLAVVQFSCSFSGTILGLVILYFERTATGLLGNILITQFLLLLILLAKYRKVCLPGKVSRADLVYLRFSGKVTLSNLGYYIQQNSPRLFVGRIFGQQVLGYWNRAEVLTMVPFQAVQTAFIQTVYPQFSRVGGDLERSRRAWTLMLSLGVWFCLPTGVLLAVLLPNIIRVIYGPGLQSASHLAPALAMAWCLLPLMSLLAAGLEQRGNFRLIYISQFLSLIAVAATLLISLLLRNEYLAVIALVTGLGLQHIVQLAIAKRLHLIETWSVVKEYCAAVLFSIAIGSASLAVGGFAQRNLSGPLLVLVFQFVTASAIAGLLITVAGRRLTAYQVLRGLGGANRGPYDNANERNSVNDSGELKRGRS
ncbi:MAG: oligosaccharide flippase family protein [Gordonia polyisoprenivorans]|nr:oligosaccharide flippase family protein [Gordonia polyisoprenivorans]